MRAIHVSKVAPISMMEIKHSRAHENQNLWLTFVRQSVTMYESLFADVYLCHPWKQTESKGIPTGGHRRCTQHCVVEWCGIVVAVKGLSVLIFKQLFKSKIRTLCLIRMVGLISEAVKFEVEFNYTWLLAWMNAGSLCRPQESSSSLSVSFSDSSWVILGTLKSPREIWISLKMFQ